MEFTNGQLEKLSELSLDIAKGLFLTSFAVPAIYDQATLLASLRSFGVALTFVYIGIRIEGMKGKT
jgi:hypothetical protein